MKRIVFAIILATIIALLIATWFVNNQISEMQSYVNDLQRQNSDLQDQINELHYQNRDLQEENSELQQQLDLLQKRISFEPEVEITKFSAPKGWQYIGGTAMILDCTIIISNTGLTDLEGLTLEVQRRDLEEDPDKVTYELDVLPAGETTEIQFIATSSLDLGFDFSYVATLKLSEVVLDVKYRLA